MEQHSIEWYKARLGCITGSMVYTLMGKARKKEETWSETAKGYLYQVAAERNINEVYLGAKFDEWLSRTNVETFAMRYGTETEALARENYFIQLEDGLDVVECGCIKHGEIEHYGDSPDGLVVDKEGKTVGVLEIKCPAPNTWMKYKALFKEGKSLKDVEEKYWWQVQSHMAVTGVEWCDFVFFDKMQKDSLQVVRVARCEEDIKTMLERIREANEFIEKLIE